MLKKKNKTEKLKLKRLILKNGQDGGWRDGSADKSTALLKVLSSIPSNHLVAHKYHIGWLCWEQEMALSCAISLTGYKEMTWGGSLYWLNHLGGPVILEN